MTGNELSIILQNNIICVDLTVNNDNLSPQTNKKYSDLTINNKDTMIVSKTSHCGLTRNNVNKNTSVNMSCTGVLNYPQQKSNFDSLLLFCKYAIIQSNAPYIFMVKKDIPQINSKNCDDLGIWRSKSLGWKCEQCYKVFQSRAVAIWEVIHRRRNLFKKALQCLSKPYLSEEDVGTLISFIKTSKSNLTADGNWLVKCAHSMSDYYSHSKMMICGRRSKRIMDVIQTFLNYLLEVYMFF